MSDYSFIEVMKSRARMCDVNRCGDCDLNQYENSASERGCDTFIKSEPEKAQEIIMNWAKEHPAMSGCKNCESDKCIWRDDKYYEKIKELESEFESKLLSFKTDILNEFVEDLYVAILRIKYCNNKEIGDYILESQLVNEIDILLLESKEQEDRSIDIKLIDLFEAVCAKSKEKTIKDLMQYLDLECSQFFDNDHSSSNKEPMYLCSDINKWIEKQLSEMERCNV